MLDKLNVREKLGIGFGAILLLMLAMAIVSLSQLAHIKGDLDDIMSDRYPKIVLGNEIIKRTLDNGRTIRNAILVNDPAQIESLIQKSEAARKDNTESLRKMEALLSTPRGRELFADIMATRERLSAAYEKIYPLLRARNTADSTNFLLKEFAPANNAYMAALEAMAKFQSDLMEKRRNTANQAYGDIRLLMFGSLGLSMLLGLTIALLLSRQLSNQIQTVVHQSEKIADGDFSPNGHSDMPLRTEIGRLMNAQESMRIKLIDALQAVRSCAHQVNDSARELASVSQQVAVSVQKQANSTEAASATLEQLSVSIDHISENAVDASRQATQAGRLAEDGRTDAEESIDRMRGVDQTVRETSEEMARLTHEVQGIGNIATVIRDVADQTNLLALNAAIEAARAGESGRGFAVVADEVRKLAERTTSSAQEITRMINSIQKDAERVMSSMEASRQSVRGMTETSDHTNNLIQEVEHSTTEVLSAISNINTALGEQRAASQDLAKNMETVAQMAEENSSTVEELATTSHQLMELSGELKQVVERFHW